MVATKCGTKDLKEGGQTSFPHDASSFCILINLHVLNSGENELSVLMATAKVLRAPLLPLALRAASDEALKPVARWVEKTLILSL
jgi:hypothetical protein